MACACVASCGRRAEPTARARIDLAELASTAASQPATTHVDVAAPGCRPLLVRGWGDAVVLPDGARGVELRQGVGSVAFYAGAAPADTEIVVRRLPRPPDAVPTRRRRRPRVLIVEVNGVRCGMARPDAGTEVHCRVPADHLRPGRNLLTVRRLSAPRPRDPWAPELIATIDFRSAAAAAPRLIIAGSRLEFARGAAVTVYVEAPREAQLEVTRQAPGAVWPEVTVLSDGATPRRLRLDRVAGDTASLPLGVAAGTIVGLEFEASTPVTLTRAVVSGGEVVLPVASPPAPPPVRPNVLLYVVDTLRVDRLGCVGGTHGTTPNLDALAAESVVFERAIAHASWTKPSMASLLTGELPALHGVVTLRDRLGTELPTLAERLAAAGYDTAAFVTNINVGPQFGFGRGFGLYRYLPEDENGVEVHVAAEVLDQAGLEWLDRRPADRPFFLYLHATDVHAPYAPRAPWRARFARTPESAVADSGSLARRLREARGTLTDVDVGTLSDLYDAEVASLDDAFGRFWKTLRARGRDRDTLVVFVADHGEEFRDHGGLEHGHTLFDELVHVPLIIRLPDGAGGGRRTATLVRLVDVLPTILGVVGIAPDPQAPGLPLVDGTGADVAAAPQVAIAASELGRRQIEAVVTGRWKVIFPPVGATRATRVFDLQADPLEKHDLAEAHPVLIGWARQVLAGHAASATARGAHDASPPLDAATRERLRRLGYVVD
jgi:arylsulfatase A-like enzyme